MVKKTTAVKPNFFNQFISLKEKELAKKAGVNEEELAYYSMSKTLGWKHFKNLANHLIEELDQLNEQAIAKGANYEELGKNTIVVSLTKGIIRRLLNKVEDIREVCEKPKKR